MPLRPDIADLMLAIDGLEEVKAILFDRVAPTEEEMQCEREMMRSLAILHAHVRSLLDAEL